MSKNDKNIFSFKKACLTKKAPAALNNVANMVGVTNIDEILTNSNKYWIINN